MQNKLKPQSSNIVQQLRTANIKCVMVTGKHIIWLRFIKTYLKKNIIVNWVD